MTEATNANRVFPPPSGEGSSITGMEEYLAMYRRSVEDPESF